MTLGKLLFLVAVYVAFVAIGVVIGYFITPFLSDVVARHRVRRIQKQSMKQFEKLKK